MDGQTPQVWGGLSTPLPISVGVAASKRGEPDSDPQARLSAQFLRPILGFSEADAEVAFGVQQSCWGSTLGRVGEGQSGGGSNLSGLGRLFVHSLGSALGAQEGVAGCDVTLRADPEGATRLVAEAAC